MGTRRAVLASVILLVLSLGACAGSPGGPSPAATATLPPLESPPVAKPPSPEPPSPEPTLGPPSAGPTHRLPTTEPTLEPPPTAILIVGEQRFPGEVGSYAWPGGAESAPWLPAAGLDRVPIPGGVPVRLEVPGGPALAAWTATSATADDPRATNRVAIGEGRGRPTFDTPAAGEWVVAVQVQFEDGLGEATWFWHLAVE